MLAALSSVVTGSLKLSQLDHRALDEGSERGCKVEKVILNLKEMFSMQW